MNNFDDFINELRKTGVCGSVMFSTLDFIPEIARLRAENAALRLDRERLEAVAANGWRLSCEFGANGHPNHWICYDKDWSQPEGEGETYNAAIDAARHSLNP